LIIFSSFEAFQFEVILFKARRSPEQPEKIYLFIFKLEQIYLLITKRKGMISTKVIASMGRDEIRSINNVGREAKLHLPQCVFCKG